MFDLNINNTGRGQGVEGAARGSRARPGGRGRGQGVQGEFRWLRARPGGRVRGLAGRGSRARLRKSRRTSQQCRGQVSRPGGVVDGHPGSVQRERRGHHL